MLENGSFEEPWIDLPPQPGYLINQQPAGWTLSWVEPGQMLYDSQDKAEGIPECVHKLSIHLPPDEQLGTPNALILEGAVTYKISHGSVPFGAELRQTMRGLQPGTQGLLTVPILAVLYGEQDEYEVETGAWVDTMGSEKTDDWAGQWVTGRKMGNRRWYTHEVNFIVPASGMVTVIVRVKGKSPQAKVFFLDDIRLETMAVLGVSAPSLSQAYYHSFPQASYQLEQMPQEAAIDIGGDQIAVGDISNSQGIAIGAGAMVRNETHHHYYGESDEDESPKIEEAIRLDAAAPAEVFKKQAFDIAVAVRQPDSPQLAVDDLPVVVSESGSVFRSEADEIIQYRLEVSGKGFVVKPESYTLKLRPGVDSKVCIFQVTPLKAGKKSLLINAYQENDVVAAQTRIQLAVAVKVSSEAQFLHFLVGQLEVFLHIAPPERESIVKELEDGVNLLIQMATDSPNPSLLKIMGASLAGPAQKLEADSPGIMASLERVVTAVVAMADNQT